jgi:hypothetical protein
MRPVFRAVGVLIWTRRLPILLSLTVIGLLLACVLVLPDYLVARDLEGKPGPPPGELLGAKNDVRSTLLQAVEGGFLLSGLYLTYRTIQVNREGQITERFTRAIDHLGGDKVDVRLGGIYALERIARDSRSDHGPVMEVLTAFIREHAPRTEQAEDESEPTRPSADIQAALAVIGRRNVRYDAGYLNLGLTKLEMADLRGANLQGTDLDSANLQRVNLPRANLQGTDLDRPTFRGPTSTAPTFMALAQTTRRFGLEDSMRLQPAFSLRMSRNQKRRIQGFRTLRSTNIRLRKACRSPPLPWMGR